MGDSINFATVTTTLATVATVALYFVHKRETRYFGKINQGK